MNLLPCILFFFYFNNCLSFTLPIKNIKKQSYLKMIDIDYFNNFQNALLVNGVGYSLLKNSNQKSLTNEGLVHSTALGIGLLTFLGLKGYFVCLTYFILGSIVTKIKMNKKEEMGIAEKRGGRRGPENVWGSAGIAMFCAIATFFFKESDHLFELYKLGYLSSLVTKLSDTFQSEIGKAYGKTTILITNFKKVPPGTEGAISIEGYIAGIIGSFILSYCAYLIGFVNDINQVKYCIASALFATTLESYIGASYQNNTNFNWLSNEKVNFINTFIGAILAIFFYENFS